MAELIQPPSDVPECMWPMWVGCLRWAIGNSEILAAFTADTGLTYSPPKSGLDAMIDEASGFNEKLVKSFVEWFNKNVWGPWE
jgi:hypothetical protein